MDRLGGLGICDYCSSGAITVLCYADVDSDFEVLRKSARGLLAPIPSEAQKHISPVSRTSKYDRLDHSRYVIYQLMSICFLQHYVVSIYISLDLSQAGIFGF